MTSISSLTNKCIKFTLDDKDENLAIPSLQMIDELSNNIGSSIENINTELKDYYKKIETSSNSEIQSALDIIDERLEKKVESSDISFAYDEDAKTLGLSAFGNEIASINCTQFLKDGMLSSVNISKDNILWMYFNIDGRSEPISVDMQQLVELDEIEVLSNEISTSYVTKKAFNIVSTDLLNQITNVSVNLYHGTKEVSANIEHQIKDVSVDIERQMIDISSTLDHQINQTSVNLDHQMKDNYLNLEHQIKDVSVDLEHQIDTVSSQAKAYADNISSHIQDDYYTKEKSDKLYVPRLISNDISVHQIIKDNAAFITNTSTLRTAIHNNEISFQTHPGFGYGHMSYVAVPYMNGPTRSKLNIDHVNVDLTQYDTISASSLCIYLNDKEKTLDEIFDGISSYTEQLVNSTSVDLEHQIDTVSTDIIDQMTNVSTELTTQIDAVSIDIIDQMTNVSTELTTQIDIVSSQAKAYADNISSHISDDYYTKESADNLYVPLSVSDGISVCQKIGDSAAFTIQHRMSQFVISDNKIGFGTNPDFGYGNIAYQPVPYMNGHYNGSRLSIDHTNVDLMNYSSVSASSLCVYLNDKEKTLNEIFDGISSYAEQLVNSTSVDLEHQISDVSVNMSKHIDEVSANIVNDAHSFCENKIQELNVEEIPSKKSRILKSISQKNGLISVDFKDLTIDEVSCLQDELDEINKKISDTSAIADAATTSSEASEIAYNYSISAVNPILSDYTTSAQASSYATDVSVHISDEYYNKDFLDGKFNNITRFLADTGLVIQPQDEETEGSKAIALTRDYFRSYTLCAMNPNVKVWMNSTINWPSTTEENQRFLITEDLIDISNSISAIAKDYAKLTVAPVLSDYTTSSDVSTIAKYYAESAINLIPLSVSELCDDTEYATSVEVSSIVSAYVKASAVKADEELSLESENPVQNKVITKKLAERDYTGFQVWPTNSNIEVGTAISTLAPIKDRLDFFQSDKKLSAILTSTIKVEIPANDTQFFTLRCNSGIKDLSIDNIIVDWGDGVTSSYNEMLIDPILSINIVESHSDNGGIETDVTFQHDYDVEDNDHVFNIKIYGNKNFGIRNTNSVTGTESTNGKNIICRCMDNECPIASNFVNLTDLCKDSYKLFIVALPNYSHMFDGVQNASRTFQNCKNLLITHNFNDQFRFCRLNCFFKGCENLTTTDIVIPSFITMQQYSQVSTGGDSITQMFEDCKNLEVDVNKILPPGGFMARRINMNDLFKNCEKLTCSNKSDMAEILWEDYSKIFKYDDSRRPFTGTNLDVDENWK